MAIYGGNIVPIENFFEFASDAPQLELVDIGISTEKETDIFLEDSVGSYRYKSTFIFDKRELEKYEINGFLFFFCKEDPREKGLTVENIISKFESKIDESFDVAMNYAISKTLGNQQISDFQHTNLVKVIASSFGEENGFPDEIVIPNSQTTSLETDYKTISKQLKTIGVDPASHASVGNFSTVSPSNAISLDSNNNFCDSVLNSISSAQPINSMLSISSLRRSLRSSRRGAQNNQLVRSKDTPTNFSKSSGVSSFDLLPTKSLATVHFQVSKKDLIGFERFYVVVKPFLKKTKNEQLFTDLVVSIDHYSNVERFLLNPEPPEVSLISVDHSRVSFLIKKVDPTLRTVQVTRITSNSSKEKNESYDLGKISFSSFDVLDFTDNVDNVKPNKHTYRFSVVNSNGSLGEFTSIVAPSYKKTSDPLKTGGVPLSIMAINKRDGIEVDVQILADDILTIRLLRQEIGKYGNFSDSITQIYDTDDSPDTITQGKKVKIKFIDKNALLGKKYRYFVAYRRGAVGSASLSEEILSDEDEPIVRKFYLGRLPFSVAVSDPTISQVGSPSVNVNFSITSVETSELFNTVTSALQDAGIGAEFLSQLQADNVKSKLFTMFLVERFEIETGRRVSFGFFPVGNFSDSPALRKKLQIPDPNPEYRYIYFFKTCLQSPEVFLQTTSVGLISRSGQTFQKSASRFARQIYTSLGILPPEASVKNGTSIEEILLGSQIGLELVKEVNFSSFGVQVENLNILHTSRSNDISWSISGNSSSISYFLIYCTVNNEENLLGAVSCNPTVSQYLFRDDRYFGEVGKKSYRIAAINHNDDETVNSPTASTDKLFSVPQNLVFGAIFGNFGRKNKLSFVSHYSPESFEKFNPFSSGGKIDAASKAGNFGKAISSQSSKAPVNIKGVTSPNDKYFGGNPNMPNFGGGSKKNTSESSGFSKSGDEKFKSESVNTKSKDESTTPKKSGSPPPSGVGFSPNYSSGKF